MALFGRRAHRTPEPEPEPDVPQAPPPGEPGVDRDWVREHDGPWDEAEASDDEGRIDLGSMRVRGVPGMEMRLDLEQATQQIVGVTCAVGGSRMQLQAFAAPRSSGIWDDIRSEIADGIQSAGGQAELADGLLGPELRCLMPGRAPDGRVALQPARFLGVDGPRWFLRAVISGPAAGDDARVQGLVTLLRDTVVVRGDEARAPREVLPLRPPASPPDADQQAT